MQRCGRTSISKVQWSNSKSEGEQRVLLYPPRRWNLISIFRALKPPSFLNLSPLKPSQNGVDARSDRSVLVHLDLDAHLSQAPSGSETWRFRTLLEDAKGLCRTRCQCLANRPPSQRVGEAVICKRVDCSIADQWYFAMAEDLVSRADNV
jgi:hypothetical protein